MTDTNTTIAELNAFELARMADVPSPDSTESPGAKFLESVRDTFEDYVQYADDPIGLIEVVGDMAHEIADSCVPAYSHARWQTFVDLAAYEEDVTEIMDPSSMDMTEQAGVALYLIAQRLVHALADEIDEEE